MIDILVVLHIYRSTPLFAPCGTRGCRSERPPPKNINMLTFAARWCAAQNFVCCLAIEYYHPCDTSSSRNITLISPLNTRHTGKIHSYIVWYILGTSVGITWNITNAVPAVNMVRHTAAVGASGLMHVSYAPIYQDHDCATVASANILNRRYEHQHSVTRSCFAITSV